MPSFLPSSHPRRRGDHRRARRRQRGRDRRSPARPGPDADADRACSGRRCGCRRRGNGACHAAAPRAGSSRRQVTRDQLLAITRELATLLRAGLTLDRALEILIGLAATPAVAQLLQGVRDDVRGGKSLSQALDARREVFSRFYVNIVRAGEAGGALGVVLQRLADTMERNKELRETVQIRAHLPDHPGLRRGAVGDRAADLRGPAVRADVRAGRQGAAAAHAVVIFVGKFLREWWWAIIAVVVVGARWFRRRGLRRRRPPRTRCAPVAHAAARRPHRQGRNRALRAHAGDAARQRRDVAGRPVDRQGDDDQRRSRRRARRRDRQAARGQGLRPAARRDGRSIRGSRRR